MRVWQTSQRPVPGADALAKLPSALPERLSNTIGRSSAAGVRIRSRTRRMLSLPCGSWQSVQGRLWPGGTWVATRAGEWQSAHALVASPYKSAYVAAKHGIAGLTKTVALEVAQQGITMNAICPGYVWTPLVEKQIPDTAKARGLTEQQVISDVLLHAQPTKKFVQVDEIAALAAFLASDAAASLTGAIIPVDGGWTSQ